MEKEKQTYETIVEQILKTCEGTYEGKMMSSPGVKYNNKVLVFYYKSAMVFRLGSNFIPEEHQIKTAHLLSPFKTKPPLKGWFIIEHEEAKRWEELAYMAYEFVKQLKD